MRKILEELWRGNITPQSKTFHRGTAYDEAVKMLCKNEEDLKAALSEKEWETFEKFCDCQNEITHYTQEDIFVTAFRLGARIVMESFGENDGIFGEMNA